MPVPPIIEKLVEQFARNQDAYRAGQYKEAQVRQEFINPFWEAPGWDVYNKQGYSEKFQEVVHEDTIQVRGSLRRFYAVRGTIITSGGFSRGTVQAAFERGAAPITLIDGEKLLDLLVEHEIGASRSSIDYIDFDAEKLAQFESEDAEEPNT